MRQLSLVALYGAKPAPLAELVFRCQERIVAACGAAFRPYGIEQVHGTLIGLERAPGPRRVGRAPLVRGEAEVEMDVAGFLAFLKGSEHLPFHVRLGGFVDRDESFTSRGERPFVRSFSIQGDRAVLMGWPRADEPGARPPETLEVLRRSALRFGIRHTYHRTPRDVDNDFYLRLGLLDRQRVDGSQCAEIEAELRAGLATGEPVVLELALADLHLVSYEDETLATARSVSLADFDPRPAAVDGLYR